LHLGKKTGETVFRKKPKVRRYRQKVGKGRATNLSIAFCPTSGDTSAFTLSQVPQMPHSQHAVQHGGTQHVCDSGSRA